MEPADTSVPAPDPERTQALPSPDSAESVRRLAADLSRRGVPPEEIQRLLSLHATTAAAGQARRAPPTRPSAPDEPPAFVPRPTIILPPPREPTPQERVEADRHLTVAYLARRRGNLREAETRCRAAIDLNPTDAGALELYGDVLQGLGRVDDAILCYRRAADQDPRRASAEKKYAELMLLQNRSIQTLQEEFIARNPTVAVMFSALMPGAGQAYNGDGVKGVLLGALWLALLYLLGWSPWGFPGLTVDRVPGSLYVLILLAGADYLYSVADANLGARRGKRRRSGWEV